MKIREVHVRNTHRPFPERAALVGDRHLGAGNFFWRSYRLLSRKDQPLFYTDGDRVFTPRDLARQVAALMAFYRSEGVEPESHVGLRCSDGVTGFVHHVAITSLGAVAVHCNPAMPRPQAEAYFTAAAVNRVFAEDAGERWSALQGLRVSPPEIDEIPNPTFNSDHVTMISHSSGTTGTPKTPLFTHEGFFKGKRGRLFTFPQERTTRLLTSLPHSHSAGLSYMSTALLTATPLYVQNRRSPVTIEAAISSFRPAGVLSFPSAFGDLDPWAIDEKAREGLRFWNGMGDASHADHIRRLLRACPNAVYIDGLGSSEMGMVLFQTVKDRDVVATRIVGEPAPVVQDAAVFDSAGRRLPRGTPGRLGVLTPSSTPGYFADPELTRQSQIGSYFLTGDIAQELEDGRWRHLDRVSDVIASPEGDVYSTLMEELVHEAIDVQDCAVVGIHDRDGSLRPVVFAVPRAASTLTAAESHARIVEQIDAAAEPCADGPRAVVLLAGIDYFPRGVTGKALKRVLRDEFASCLEARRAPSSSGVLDAHYA